MHIIPVLDLMNGRVVHGIRGERNRYRPVESCLTKGSDPLDIARALQDETGCRQMYVADLDALQGCGDHGSQIRSLADALEIALWVDAGVTDAATGRQILSWNAARVIVGSETLSDQGALSSVGAAVPADRRIFSMDILNGRVMSSASFLNRLAPLDALAIVAGQGWGDVILLALDQVGTGSGPDWDLLACARRRFPQLSLYAGGGIRSFDDIRRLTAMGIDGVLVATAVHNGRITGRQIAGLDRSQPIGQENKQ